jgi:hypothetical protein
VDAPITTASEVDERNIGVGSTLGRESETQRRWTVSGRRAKRGRFSKSWKRRKQASPRGKQAVRIPGTE